MGSVVVKLAPAFGPSVKGNSLSGISLRKGYRLRACTDVPWAFLAGRGDSLLPESAQEEILIELHSRRFICLSSRPISTNGHPHVGPSCSHQVFLHQALAQ